MAIDPGECCNPTAKSNAERCIICPMRQLEAEPVRQKKKDAPSAKSDKPARPDWWKKLYDQIPRE